MTEIYSRYAPCLICKHLKDGFKCMAFINGIPNVILSGENQHDKPLPEQDNDIVFERVEDKQ